jgi:hypothetical protein
MKADQPEKIELLTNVIFFFACITTNEAMSFSL